MDADFMAKLASIEGLVARFNEPMSAHTTWRVGGPVWCLATASDLEQAKRVLAACAAHGREVKALGRGSNLLVGDDGWPGVLLRMRDGLASLKREGDAIVAGGGVYLSAAVKLAAREGLAGLEWAAGIPGTAGGALATNAGAHESDMAAVSQGVTLLLPGGDLRQCAAADLPAAYRRRVLPAGALVVAARLALVPDDPTAVATRVKQNLKRRAASQPLGAATAGSVFINPPGDYASRLIEAAGLKGLTRGRARVSPRHANFIENTGGARAAEVLALMDEIRARVLAQWGVDLTPEVEVLGRV